MLQVRHKKKKKKKKKIKEKKERKQLFQEKKQEFPGAQRIKDLVLSLLWCMFDPWPGNFPMPWVGPKKENIEHVRAFEI